MQLPTVRFSRDTTGFSKTLRARVEEHFQSAGKSRFADHRMVVKSAVMLLLYFVPLVFITAGWTGGGWGFWLAAFVMGLGLAGIGLNIMHDANHGAYSKHKWVNEVMGRMLDVVGGNAALWKIQHNVLHHTFTNIEGLDEDIDTPGILRFTPDRPLKGIHRFQHIYAWLFYAIMSLFFVLDHDERLDFGGALPQDRHARAFWIKFEEDVGVFDLDQIPSLRLHPRPPHVVERIAVVADLARLGCDAHGGWLDFGLHFPTCPRHGRALVRNRGKGQCDA